MKYIIPIAACAFLISCGDEKPTERHDSAVATVPAVVTISDVQAYRPNIDLTPWDGNLNDAIYWRDSRGENAVVVSSKPQYFWEEENPKASAYFPKGEDPETLSELTEIFVTHFVLKSGENQWKEFNHYHDFLFGCCDVYMAYQPASLQVLDSDSNGIGECALVYHKTEGDGLLSHSFIGTLILELDSSYYMIQSPSGLGAEIDREAGIDDHERVSQKLPTDTTYAGVMKRKWMELYKAKVELDRAEVTEQNNVDENGHADHHH